MDDGDVRRLEQELSLLALEVATFSLRAKMLADDAASLRARASGMWAGARHLRRVTDEARDAILAAQHALDRTLAEKTLEAINASRVKLDALDEPSNIVPRTSGLKKPARKRLGAIELPDPATRLVDVADR